MAKAIALFSGQGAQFPGMGRELYESISRVREIYQCAGDIFGFDVARTSFEGQAEDLARTEVAQPAIFTLSVAAWEAAALEAELPRAVAGHSLGEYAALYAAGVCSLEDTMGILKARATGMGEASRANRGVMYAVMGKDADTVTAACAQVGDGVWPVNFNLPTQTVIAGTPEACEQAAALLSEQGAKTVRLEVEGAFHTRLMESAAPGLRAAAEQAVYHPAGREFYSNTTGAKAEVSNWPEYVVRHMLSPVRFVEEMQAVAADGWDTCIEFGPKRVCTLAKKNNRAFTVLNVEDLSSLKKGVEVLSQA